MGTSFKAYLITALILWNIITLLLMAIDKRKAQKHKRRISEKTLFGSAFLFGGIGAMFGMIGFRHKTKHLSFKVLIPLAVLLNLVFYYFVFLKMN